MEIGETLLVTTRQEWRAWLAQHHRDRKEIWLIYYKKGSSKTGISYEESVEEALCFGWIDGINKGIDEETYAGRFTPRLPKSPWSSSNRARVARLLEEGRMTEAGLALLPAEMLQENQGGVGKLASLLSLEESGCVVSRAVSLPPPWGLGLPGPEKDKESRYELRRHPPD